MKQNIADSVCARLTPFQRLTVDHIMRRFHGPTPSRRFLVADETGLGKSIVARGVVARTIDQLQQDDSVDRIDIVYVCSNQDLAAQNLRRLNVMGNAVHPMNTRLTMLASQTGALNARPEDGSKPVNLVSFTPATSFQKGWSGGRAEERAMLHVILGLVLDKMGRNSDEVERASAKFFRGGVRSIENFRRDYLAWPQWQSRNGRLDPDIIASFETQLTAEADGGDTLLQRTLDMFSSGAPKLPTEDHWRHIWKLTGELRSALARAGVNTLEPDLVILDEFQRFRELLDPETESGELAHALFTHPNARTLLLSATPYKPFTFAEEGEDHEQDFMAVLRFLADGGAGLDVDEVREGFAAIREGARRGQAPQVELERLSSQLRQVMTRWERPTLDRDTMHREVISPADQVLAADLKAYMAASDVARAVARPKDHRLVSAEYWKSAPYFLNFCGGYKLGERLTHHEGKLLDAWPDAARAPLRSAALLSSEQTAAFRAIEPGNARMRVLYEQTLDRGWWKLLWLPATLPYVEPSHAYAEPWVAGMTKRLVFSSWTATPAAVASMLSYEAERRMAEPAHGREAAYAEYTPEGRRKVSRGFGYSVSGDRPSNMTTLLMMWPLTRLATLGDVRAMARANGGRPVTSRQAVKKVADRLKCIYGGNDDERPAAEGVGRDVLWRTVFNDPANWLDVDLEQSYERVPDSVRPLVTAMTRQASSAPGVDDDTDADGVLVQEGRLTGLDQHVLHALASRRRGHVEPDLRDRHTLARVALFAPGCVSLRVIGRLVDCSDDLGNVSEPGRHQAAAALANGVRSLFQRPEVIALLSKGTYEKYPTWQAALHYCAHGNLEAVLDEWAHQVWSDSGRPRFNDETLVAFAQELAGSIGLRSATYTALDPGGPRETLAFNGGFAARYGGRDQKAEDARQPQVRAAFNSPFWPFVLASTSVGQEGVDFHWWCHAVFHWNTPPNPVDFEQREGRVDRYHGHAVRKNIAQAHSMEILSSDAANPWSRAYACASAHTDDFGFAPDWVYPGDARIERHVAPIAFSTEQSAYQRVKQDVAFYRVALGQPRQEDMIDMMRESSLSPEELRIDLRPLD